MISREATYRHRLAVSGGIMLAGILLLIVPIVLNIAVPISWTREMALFVVCGAAVELYAVWRFVRADR
jgi:hypothetical protein